MTKRPQDSGATAAPVNTTALFERLSRPQTDLLGVRVLRSVLLTIALVVGVGVLLTLVLGNPFGLAVPRLAMSLVLLAFVGVSEWLSRRQHQRAAAWVLALGATLALEGAGFGTRLGLNAVAVSGMALLITLIGAVLTLRSALVLAGIHLVSLGTMAWMHSHGIWLLDLGPRAPSDVLLSHLLLTGASVAGAAIASKLVAGTLGRALSENRRTAELLRISSDWTYVLNAKGRLVDISPSFESHTGLRVDDFLNLDEPGRPRLRDDVGARQLREALQAQRAFRNQRLIFDLPGGGWLAVQGNGEPLYDEDGRFLGWWGASRNVTAQVEVELALAEARSRAEAANEAKSAFLATMSHEIRTPINGVLGLARLVRRLPADQTERREELLDLLSGAATELSDLVNDVLDLSRLEAGKLSLRPATIDLHRLAESCLRAPATLGRERGLTLTLQIAPDVPRHVVTDPLRLRQILDNLLGNALKFTDRGEIVLALRLAAPDRLAMEVRDSGIGVAPEMRARLFQPFEQADATRRRRHGGSGLGLSICAEIARLMGGRIEHQDADGGGSRFIVELPLELPAQLPAVPAEPAPHEPLRGLRVLLVEDNTVNMMVASALLAEQGAEVLEAADGEQALALARQHGAAIHAVLMDLHMPGMDGFETTDALRALPGAPAWPVLALSASVLSAERERARAHGMADFLVKPIETEELVRALKRYAV
ncbi:response regulator [Ideonella sp. 4Y16]|uniref:Virulence sensor protein BvgS n=1 Tax=Ideonella alba TaxID=2824118 RepID=A0A940YBA6_9BURK|nr:PAS domain-containing hybrid sensor histidine kinase/response regulator [Ideonella alba]MBQ0929562.1 response regulator [Ideonella alba]MBQ0944664.1 response regulator [Ideonella alba]